jgi:hypothetical protein
MLGPTSSATFGHNDSIEAYSTVKVVRIPSW